MKCTREVFSLLVIISFRSDFFVLGGYGRLKSAILSSLKITDPSTSSKIRENYSPKLSRKNSDADRPDDPSIVLDMAEWNQIGNFLRVELPGKGSTVVSLKEDMTFRDAVIAVTSKRQLDPEMYFIMFGMEKDSQIGKEFVIELRILSYNDFISRDKYIIV